jgi:hypothetical protein
MKFIMAWKCFFIDYKMQIMWWDEKQRKERVSISEM